MQMATVVVLVGAGLFYSLSRRPQWQSSGGSLSLHVKACLALLLFWGTTSCAVQENWLGNMAFLLVHAGMVYLLFLIGAESMCGSSKMRCIDLALVPLCLIVIVSVALFALGPSRLSFEGRFHGLYRNAIIAGQMFGLTSLLLLWRALHAQRRSWVGWVLFSLTIPCLVVTRTRTDILGAFTGMLTCSLSTMRNGTDAMLWRRTRVILASCVLLALASVAWMTRPGADISSIRDYFRMSGDSDDILRSRYEYWQTGLGKLSMENALGEGPLAKYAGQLSGERSGYVAERNMHNAFLSMSQYYGWPGGLLLIIFIVSVVGTLVKRKDPYATLGLSLLALGLTNCLSENWLLTFATPFDVYSWFLLGLVLREPRSFGEFAVNHKTVSVCRRTPACLYPSSSKP